MLTSYKLIEVAVAMVASRDIKRLLRSTPDLNRWAALTVGADAKVFL